MASPLSVVVVGAGLMGRWHAHFAAREGARIAAVVDRDPARAGKVARPHAAKVCGSLEEALALPDVAAVHLCTPAESHGVLGMEVLQAGKHLLVEKPLAPSLRESEEILAFARARSLVACPVHQFPFQPGMRKLVAARARLGELVKIAFTAFSAGGEGHPPARRRQILLEILPHPLSLLRVLLPAAAAAPVWQTLAFTDDDLELSRREGSTQVTVTLSLRARPTRAALTVAGTEGTAHADLFHGFSFLEGGKVSRARKAFAPFGHAARLQVSAGTNLVGRALRQESAYPGLRELVSAFHRAARDGSPPPVSAAEALEAAELIERLARIA